MLDPYRIAPDTFVMPATLPVPGKGVQYLNPFLILGTEPILVDTGAGVASHDFMKSLESLIDPPDIRWIFLSHDDRDHCGSLLRLLELCPQAKVVTSFQAVNRITKETALPLDRMQFANIGDSVQVGDRELYLTKPPLFDSPATRGFLDRKSGVFYAVDGFGAITRTFYERVSDVPAEEYRLGYDWLNYANTPWLSLVDPDKLRAVMKDVAAMDPSAVVSYHGPTAADPRQVNQVFRMLETIPLDEALTFPTLDELATTPDMEGEPEDSSVATPSEAVVAS